MVEIGQVVLHSSMYFYLPLEKGVTLPFALQPRILCAMFGLIGLMVLEKKIFKFRQIEFIFATS